MLDLQAIIALNSSAVLLLLVVVLSARKTIRNKLPDNRLFFLMVATAIAQAIIETVSFLTNGRAFPGSYAFNIGVTMLLYINNAFFPLLWALYVECKLFGIEHLTKRRYWLLALPAVFVLAGTLVNLFVPVFFRVEPDTLLYSRTELYLFPNLVVIFYMVYGLVRSCLYRNQNNSYIFFPVLLFMLPISLAAVIDYFCYGLNVLWIGAAISLTSVYINLQNQISYIDPLSGLFTRQYLTFYLQREIRKISPEEKLVGLMLDIDKFKSINDTYGHLVGDAAIVSTGNLLHETLSPGSCAFRLAGDEFIILQRVKTEEEIISSMRRIRRATEKFNAKQKNSYQLSLSAGYTVWNGKVDTPDMFLDRMDAAMYAAKRNKTATR